MHPNEKLLRDLDAAQGGGDVEKMFSFFADDVITHVGGRSKLAGDYKGRDEIAATFGRFVQALGENAELETHDLAASDTHGYMLQSYKGQRGGDRITIKGVAIFHISNGKISEAWFFDEDPFTADAWYDAGL